MGMSLYARPPITKESPYRAVGKPQQQRQTQAPLPAGTMTTTVDNNTSRGIAKSVEVGLIGTDEYNDLQDRMWADPSYRRQESGIKEMREKCSKPGKRQP